MLPIVTLSPCSNAWPRGYRRLCKPLDAVGSACTGFYVKAGQALLVLSAMKMETSVSAPVDGWCDPLPHLTWTSPRLLAPAPLHRVPCHRAPLAERSCSPSLCHMLLSRLVSSDGTRRSVPRLAQETHALTDFASSTVQVAARCSKRRR